MSWTRPIAYSCFGEAWAFLGWALFRPWHGIKLGPTPHFQILPSNCQSLRSEIFGFAGVYGYERACIRTEPTNKIDLKE